MSKRIELDTFASGATVHAGTYDRWGVIGDMAATPGSGNCQYIWRKDGITYLSSSGAQKILVDGVWADKDWGDTYPKYGNYIWTDGLNYYYSGSDAQLVLTDGAWVTKDWGTNIPKYGNYIWTDGTSLYYSSGTTHWVLTDGVWVDKAWTNLPSSWSTSYVWNAGGNTYYSSGSTQLKLNGDTWEEYTWNGDFAPSGYYIWTIGTEVYVSDYSAQYRLNWETETWEVMNWRGACPVSSQYIWTDGAKIYSSYFGMHFMLMRSELVYTKESGTWNKKDAYSKVNGNYVPTSSSIVVPAVAIPASAGPQTIAAGNTWFNGGFYMGMFTEVIIVDSYVPNQLEGAWWDASANQDGGIMCYVDGTKLIVAGNGSGSILANADSSYMFSDTSVTGSDHFTRASFSGLELLDMSHAELLNGMFTRCDSVVSLDLSSWDVSSATNMSEMFSNSYGILEEVNMTGWNTANVTDMSKMFSGCKGLTEIDVSHFNTANVTNMSSMFGGCTGLTSLDLSHFDTANVTSMASMFSGCKGLTEIDVSHFNTAALQNVTTMFYGCTALTNINLAGWDVSQIPAEPTSITTASPYYMKEMFRNCTSLTLLDLRNWSGPPAYTDIYVSYASRNKYGMFYNCTSAFTVYVSTAEMQSWVKGTLNFPSNGTVTIDDA